MRHTFTLANGVEIPAVGFGTYKAADNTDEAIISEAIRHGYRHLDTAAFYFNEEAVGKAVRESGIPREDFFLTSKVWKDHLGYDSTLQEFENSCKRLGTDYLDLYLIHWPRPSDLNAEWRDLDVETWKALEDLYKSKKVRAIGASNFLPHHLNNLLERTSITPMRNHIVEDIMAYKEANDLPILQPEQEARQKEWLEKRMEEKRHKAEVEDVFGSITMNSKRIQSRKLFNYNIVLIGFMGTGKSTISEFLKNSFAMEVIEMDQIIAEREGMTISDIFEVYGEQYFRNLETNLLIEMQSKTNVVISCGGGTPMRECNVVEMKKNGRVVLLTAKPETILDRVKDSHDRPLIENNKTVPFIADLMEKRREKYEAAADIIIETDGKDELQICEELILRLRQMDNK